MTSTKKELPVYGLTPFTMLDYPERTACIVWFAGCNLRCAYCHNPDIVLGSKGTMPINEIFTFLEKRQGLLNGVVLSGGEATLYPDIAKVAAKIKQMGFDVKLDTNGTKPEIVQDLIKNNLVDYIALDYKAPQAQFKLVTGTNKYKKFNETLTNLCNEKSIPFEVRITVHTDLMNEDNVTTILNDLKQKGYDGTCYIQNYRHTETLKQLNEQERILSTNEFKDSWPFKLDYRNF
jgi:pyruvate formate lyase activating enzyme